MPEAALLRHTILNRQYRMTMATLVTLLFGMTAKYQSLKTMNSQRRRIFMQSETQEKYLGVV
jgi:hypothetical protein